MKQFKNTSQVLGRLTTILLLIGLSFLSSNQAFSQNSNCLAGFSFDVDHNSMSVDLKARSNRSPVVYGWDMGDGTFIRGERQKHTYSSPGTYNVCLTAIAFDSLTNQRCTTKVCKPVLVVNCDRLRASFTLGKSGRTIRVTGQSNNNTSARQYSGFTFGDGNAVRGSNATYTYQKPGVYQVCYIVVDSIYGCRTKVCKQVVVRDSNACNVLADFNIRQSNLKIGLAARSNQTPVIYYWSYGDGNSSIGPQVRHRYKKAGSYDVCLIVFNPRTKCKKMICKKVVVTKPCLLRANFRIRQAQNIIGVKARSNLRNTIYTWDFGDGSTANGRTARHRYTSPGTYKVTLKASNRKAGCRVLVEKRVVVVPQQKGSQLIVAQDKESTTEASAAPAIEKNEILSAPTVVLSPSPAKDKISVASLDKDLNIVKIFDGQGSLVVEQSEQLKEIDITKLRSGLYYAHVYAEDGSLKIVKFFKN